MLSYCSVYFTLCGTESKNLLKPSCVNTAAEKDIPKKIALHMKAGITILQPCGNLENNIFKNHKFLTITFNSSHKRLTSGGFSTTSDLGEIFTVPPNCNSNPYEKMQRI